MKLILYVADDFKTLEGGKTLAVGLFTDRVVVLNVPQSVPSPSPVGPYGIPLALLVCLMDLPKTELTGSVTITPPSGPATMTVPSVSAKGPVGGSTNLIFRLDPFLMTGEGIYTIAVAFDGYESLAETFELRVKRTEDPAAKAVLVRHTEQPLTQ